MTPPALELSSRQRKSLRRLAHPLRPVVQIGEAGLSERVIAAIDEALDHHELIKLKIEHDRDTRQAMADTIAAQTGSALAGTVGRVAILFRPARDPERRRIDPDQGVGASSR